MTLRRITVGSVATLILLSGLSSLAEDEPNGSKKMTEQEAVDYLGVCSGVFHWFAALPDQNGSQKSLENAADNAAACGAYWKKKRARQDPRMKGRILEKSVWDFIDERLDETLSVEQQLGNTYIRYYFARENEDAVTSIMDDCRTLPELMVLLDACREIDDLFIEEK